MRRTTIIAAFLLTSALGWAQTAPGASTSEQQPPAPQQGGRPGQRWSGVAGTITAISDSSITVKTLDGQTAQISLSENTKFRKDRQPAKAVDFKVGDQIFVRGDQKDGIWQAEMVAARPAGAGRGPENFRDAMGKQFIVGEVKAINGTQLTVQRIDGVTQTITVDENTSFRNNNESITLGDIKVGDHIFGRGEMKNDVFVPSVLNIGEPRFMGQPREGSPAQK